MNRIIIAIDGYSSTGKSTVAKQLANELKYVYIDTGAMYRAVALYGLQKGFIKNKKIDRNKLVASLDQIKLRFRFSSQLGFSEMYLNEVNVERKIRGMEVSEYVSYVAEIPEVRKMLVDQQQALGKGKGVVMDGRDIGTVVFPEAELKIFMTASAETRALRRFNEMKEKGERVKFEEVLRNVQERDDIDTNRRDSPLRKAEDAVEINNSDLSREEQFDLILELAKNRIGN